VIRRALIFAALAAIASATSIIPISLEQLSKRADLVVEARAINSHSEWNAQHTDIYTFTRFAVTKTLKGASTKEVTVRQLGGKVGHIRQTVAGVRGWQPGEESVLFLRSSEAGGVMSVVGLMQGNFRITHLNGKAVASNGVPDVKAYNAGSSSPIAYSDSAMVLEQLEARVREAVK